MEKPHPGGNNFYQFVCLSPYSGMRYLQNKVWANEVFFTHPYSFSLKIAVLVFLYKIDI